MLVDIRRYDAGLGEAAAVCCPDHLSLACAGADRRGPGTTERFAHTTCWAPCSLRHTPSHYTCHVSRVGRRIDA